jgi:hypothetical protein
MKITFPTKPVAEMIGLDTMIADLADVERLPKADRAGILGRAKTAARAAMDEAQANWRAECKRIADDALRHASGLRDKATVMRADADRLRAEAQQLEGEADALVKDACYE